MKKKKSPWGVVCVMLFLLGPKVKNHDNATEQLDYYTFRRVSGPFNAFCVPLVSASLPLNQALFGNPAFASSKCRGLFRTSPCRRPEQVQTRIHRRARGGRPQQRRTCRIQQQKNQKRRPAGTLWLVSSLTKNHGLKNPRLPKKRAVPTTKK